MKNKYSEVVEFELKSDYPSCSRINLFFETRRTRVKYISISRKKAIKVLSFRSSMEISALSRSFVLPVRVLRDRSDQAEEKLIVESNAIDSRTRNIKRAAEEGKRTYRGAI